MFISVMLTDFTIAPVDKHFTATLVNCSLACDLKSFLLIFYYYGIALSIFFADSPFIVSPVDNMLIRHI